MTAETQSTGGSAGGPDDTKKKKSNLVPILIVVGIVVVIAIAAGAYFLTRDSGGADQATGKAPPRIAKDLYAAWQSGDQAAAAKVATPEAVTQIFAIKTDEGTGLTFDGCEKTGTQPVPKVCTYSRPGGELTITVSVVEGKRVASAVKLGPAATTPTSAP
jgi:hypothetical protein